MPASSPSVSVIVATYNSAKTLGPALRTAQLQEFSDFEVIVVGDGCTDDSAGVVGRMDDDRFRWVNLPVNSGTPAAPRNHGLSQARGEFAAYLGHDDLWFPWHLADMMAGIGDAALATSGALLVDAGGDPHSVVRLAAHGRSTLSPTTWLHRVGLTNSVGPWRVEPGVAEDVGFLKRTISSGEAVGAVDSVGAVLFPAAFWKPYRQPARMPQSIYLSAIEEDPHKLARDLAASALPYRKPLWRRAALAAARWYGTDRFPIAQLSRKSSRRRRGLTRLDRPR